MLRRVFFRFFSPDFRWTFSRQRQNEIVSILHFPYIFLFLPLQAEIRCCCCYFYCLFICFSFVRCFFVISLLCILDGVRRCDAMQQVVCVIYHARYNVYIFFQALPLCARSMYCGRDERLRSLLIAVYQLVLGWMVAAM